MVRSHHIKACAHSGKWPQQNRSFSYGREQATADKKQRRNLPQRTCFWRWLGQDTLWPRATRFRPVFLSRHRGLRSAGTNAGAKSRKLMIPAANCGSPGEAGRLRLSVRPSDVTGLTRNCHATV